MATANRAVALHEPLAFAVRVGGWLTGLYFLAHPLIELGALALSLAGVLFAEAMMDFVAWLGALLGLNLILSGISRWMLGAAERREARRLI